MPTSPDSDGVGILVEGVDESRPVYFYAAIGVDLDQRNLQFVSATGAPDSTLFATIDPRKNPAEFREEIIDSKIELADRDESFHSEKIESELQDVVSDNLDVFNDAVDGESSIERLEELFTNKLSMLRVSDIDVHVTSLRDLDLEDSSGTEAESGDDTEPVEESVEDGGTVLGVRPVIDVENGIQVDSLRSGTMISVKFKEDTIEAYNLDEKYEGEDPELAAEFVEFQTEPNQAEGEFLVKFQEGIFGKGRVSKTSLMKLHTEQRTTEPDGGYERELRILIISASVLLVLLMFITFLLVF